MTRVFYAALAAIATTAFVILNLTDSSNRRYHRALKQGEDTIEANISRVAAHLSHPNETISQELSTASHSYCDGNDLIEYPLPKYDACLPNSTLNIIPFFGGMTNALKYVMLGALLSFEENRCFIVSEENSHLNPGFKHGKSKTGEMGYFLNHFFEAIGLPHDHPFVMERIQSNNNQVRTWREYWEILSRRRTQKHSFNYSTAAYSHRVTNVNGIELKRDFLRHMWHLRPAYRDHTCQTLKNHDIFDTDYIAMSVRRGDKKKELHFKPPTMSDYILEAERVIPYIFKNGQTPKVFVATDDCTVLPTLRQARPQWIFISQCDQLAEIQMGYDINDIPDMNEEQREEHFRKFFVELYALALSKVYIGVAYTNVSWFAYMMRPNVDKSTFILLDKIEFYEQTLDFW